MGPLVAVLVSLPFLVVLLVRPVVRRLALRYPRRRPVESLLVVLGSMLGTGIIVGSLIVGDTIDRSIRASAYEQLGPIDELVSVAGLDEGRTLAARVGTLEDLDGADGVLDGVVDLVAAPVAVAAQRAQPRAQLVEIDFVEGRAFGSDPVSTGLVGDTPAPGRAAITTDVALATDARVGEPITVWAFGQEVELVVDRILERRGLAGFWPIDQRQQSYNVFVAPGSLAAAGLEGVVLPDGVEPPRTYVAFSNIGGVVEGATRTDRATEVVEAAVGEGLAVRPVKADLLTSADASAESLTQLYVTMGMFSVAAGVLLLVNIFVMLAEERRSQLGMLRALGMRRAPLVLAFASEGWCYAVIASVAGGLLGIWVGRLIAWRADTILSAGDDLYTLDLTFAYEVSTVLWGGALGLTISVVTILATSVRLSRLNVIAAIRDLPVPAGGQARSQWARAGLVALVVGIGWTLTSLIAEEPYGIAVAPMVAVVGAGAVVGRRLAAPVVVTIVSLIVLAWGTLFVPLLSVIDVEVGIPIFLVQGIALCAAAVALVTTHQARFGAWLSRRFGGALPVRIGLAYPIAKRFRTAMTLGMFGIVILTMVYLSVLSLMFRQQVDERTADLSGGFGVVVTSNPSDPVPIDDLAAVAGVERVAPLAYGRALFEWGPRPETEWPITGFGAEFVAAPPALVDRGDHDTDAEAWAAVAADPGKVIVDDFFLSTSGPTAETPSVGDRVVIVDPVTDAGREVEVEALATSDFLNAGAYYGIDGYRSLFGESTTESRFAVRVADDVVADEIGRTFLANGAEALVVREVVEAIVYQNTGFFALMQQFVGVGLLIGIAGIGVVMVRSVRERRRDVGALRALGFQARAVSNAFVLEAAFVAVEGVAIGVVVALIGTWGLTLDSSGVVEGFEFAVPWAEVAVIAAVALGAAGLTALVPSRRAGKIEPADALRVTD